MTLKIKNKFIYLIFKLCYYFEENVFRLTFAKIALIKESFKAIDTSKLVSQIFPFS